MSVFRSRFLLGILVAIAFCGCSSESSSDASSAVLQSGTMLYSGSVVNTLGEIVPHARVVAYYDDLNQVELGDSVVGESDVQGNFELQIDSLKHFVLFASNGTESGFANSSKKRIVVGKPLAMFSGHIEKHFTGSVRIEGLREKFELDSDGYFVFYNVPIGDINLVYVNEGNVYGFLAIETLNDRDIVVLPPLYLDENGDGRLKIHKEECYTQEGCYGARACN